MTLATEVVDSFISGRGKGLMDFGYTRCLWLDIVVVAEGDIGGGTPNVLLEAWIVDKGIPVFLDPPNSLITIKFLLAHRVVS